MRFFTKLVFICNLSFIAAVVLRLVELVKRSRGNFDPAISLAPLEATIVVLGYTAILINAVFFIYFLYLLSIRKVKQFPSAIVLFNLILFPVQVWYFFFSKF